MENRPKITWKIIQEFEENGIVVQVSASETSRPRYTFKVGRRGENGLIPFLQAFVEGQGKVRVRPVAETVAALLNRAEEYVCVEAQRVEDEWVANRLARDERGAARDGKKRRGGYKNQDRGGRWG